MSQFKYKILAIDDEKLNLDILQEYLELAGYDVVRAENGKIGLDKLDENRDIDLVLLDRMMPSMSGMEVLEQMQSNTRLKEIPVIMQTALTSSKDIADGVKSGVFYYLTKPYDDVVLLSVVKAAIEHRISKKLLFAELKKQTKTLNLMQEGKFHFRNLEDVQNLSLLLANCYTEPDNAALGLSEIMLNAVEHGNLGISYEEKTRLIREDKYAWRDEVYRRLGLEENKDKYATALFEDKDDVIKVTIEDCGNGFNHKNFSELTAERAMDANGRGIIIAKTFIFDLVEYIGSGNKVVCTYYKKLRDHDIRFNPNKGMIQND